MPCRSLIPGATLLPVALAGCGGSSGPSLSAFKSGFSADKAQFRQLGADLGASLQSAPTKTNSQIATEFGALSARATQQAVQLRKLNPPAKYKSDLDQLPPASPPSIPTCTRSRAMPPRATPEPRRRRPKHLC